MTDFTQKRSAEVEVFTLDFINVLAGELILTATWAMTVYSGSDPSPNLMLQGGCTFVGGRVSQILRNGIAGVYYSPLCTVTTSGGRTLILPEPSNGLLFIDG